jgi:hypothetical protein
MKATNREYRTWNNSGHPLSSSHAVGNCLWNGGGDARKARGLFTSYGDIFGREPGTDRTHHPFVSKSEIAPTTNNSDLDNGYNNSNVQWSY